MRLTATLLLETDTASAIPCILMLHPQNRVGQIILLDEIQTSIPCPSDEYKDTFGNRCLRTILPAGPFSLNSTIIADCAATIDVAPEAGLVPMNLLPDEVLQFLLPSRYCEADRLGEKARTLIAGIPSGYAQVEYIRGWISDHFVYAYGTTNSSTSAIDVLAAGTGVCRDYAHAGIALCRALDIPARMVVGYLYRLEPMDLHAWFEAFIGGRWYTFDATQDQQKGNRIVVACGRDAADVAIATYFEDMSFTRLKVTVDAVTI
jgi:transglutaminase-like putative cysteine protease